MRAIGTIVQACAIVLMAADATVAQDEPLGSKPAPRQDEPIVWSLTVTTMARPIRRGDELTATVTAAIQDGWHLYSTEAVRGGPTPTSITVTGGQPFELAGVIESPLPKSAYDGNFRTDVEFYEEAVTFALPLRARVTPAASASTLRVQVRFQACNDRICLAPRTVTLVAALSRTPSN